MTHISQDNRKIISVLTLAFLVALVSLVFSCNGPSSAEPVQQKKQNEEEQSTGAVPRVMVTYFHTTARCPTCLKIERYSQETVEKYFSEEIDNGKVVFRSLNMDEPENKHYIDDYKLFTKSLVVSRASGAKEIQWKNLPDIWKLVRNQEKFEEYVINEVNAYLESL